MFQNELRREVYEGSPEDKLELTRLRGEVEKLRERLQQPSSPKRLEASDEEEPSAQVRWRWRWSDTIQRTRNIHYIPWHSVHSQHIDDLVQNCNISIANALKILQSCNKR